MLTKPPRSSFFDRNIAIFAVVVRMLRFLRFLVVANDGLDGVRCGGWMTKQEDRGRITALGTSNFCLTFVLRTVRVLVENFV